MVAAGSPGERVVIVGAGPAAAFAALAAREAGHAGPITLIGNERWFPYERPVLSKAFLTGNSARADLVLPLQHQFDALGIQVRLDATVETIDRKDARVRLSSRDSLPYDRLLLACGARARRLEVPGADLPNVHHLRTIDDACRIRDQWHHWRRVLITGAGLIGMELAAVAASRGCEVIVVEQADRSMARVVPAGLSRAVEQRHIQRGVRFDFGTAVQAIESAGDGSLMVSHADAPPVQVDAVLVGIGAVPNDELAASAGLAVRTGIVTDQYGRTEDPLIFAAGDAALSYDPLLERHVRFESWQGAQERAALVGRAIAGRYDTDVIVPWFWSDQYDFTVQVAGAPEHWDGVIVRRQPDGSGETWLLAADGRLTGAATINAIRDMRLVRKALLNKRRFDVDKASDVSTPLAQCFA